MATNIYRTFGDATYPTPSSDVVNEQLYSVIDPARGIMLGLFSAAINFELGGGTASVASDSLWGVARVGTKHAAALPVADTYFEVPTKETLRRTDLAFPLLSLGRVSGEAGEDMLEAESDTCRWQLDYNLGPLKEPDLRRLGAMLKAVRDQIQLAIRAGCHSAYASGAAQLEGFRSLKMTSYQMGAASFGEADEGVIFHALSATLESVELDGAVTGALPAYEGTSIKIAGGGGSDGLLGDVIDARTEVAVENPVLL